jgi:hypothetical protein
MVLAPTRDSVSVAMQRLLGGHAQAFNRRHERVGPLFRDRFWSRPIDGDTDLLAVIAYVIRNPLEAGLVADLTALRSHRWTSLHELLPGNRLGRSLVHKAAALVPVGADELGATRRLLERLEWHDSSPSAPVESAVDEPRGAETLSRRARIELSAAGLLALRLRGERIGEALRDRDSVTERRLRLCGLGWDLERIVKRAASICRANVHTLRAGSRARRESRARSLIACYGGLYLRLSDTAIARATGVSRQSVHRSKRVGVVESSRLGVSWIQFFEVLDELGEATG